MSEQGVEIRTGVPTVTAHCDNDWESTLVVFPVKKFTTPHVAVEATGESMCLGADRLEALGEALVKVAQAMRAEHEA